MSLKKRVFSCVLQSEDTKGVGEEIEIDARRSCNELVLSIVRTNKSPQKELEIDANSEICRSQNSVILGDYGITLTFKSKEEAVEFRKYTDFRYVI